MLRLLVIIFALVLTAASGFGGLIHFGVIPDVTGLIKPDQGENGESEKAPPPRIEPVFMTLEPFLIPVIRDGKVVRNLYIGLRLDVAPDRAQQAQQSIPRLHDAFMRTLFEVVPELLEERSTVDVEKMKWRLQTVADEVVGPGVIQDVMVQALFDR